MHVVMHVDVQKISRLHAVLQERKQGTVVAGPVAWVCFVGPAKKVNIESKKTWASIPISNNLKENKKTRTPKIK